MSNKTCYLNAMGIINTLGNSKSEVLANLLKGAQDHFEKKKNIVPEKEVYIGSVKTKLPEIPKEFEFYQTRNNSLLLASYFQIQDEITAAIKKYGKDRVAIILGSSTSGIAEGEVAMQEKIKSKKFPDSYNYAKQEMAFSSEFLVHYLGLESFSYTISTACSSSAKIFGSARNLLNTGICDAVIVGGVDSLCKLTLNGFYSLESISPSICNPMSGNRDGITIGEGACLFLMTKEPSPIKLMGVGESSDAFHISSPDPEGIGAKTSMLNALQDSCLEPEDISYINMHGTATIKNDQVESKAINAVFGNNIFSSSTKSLTGHTLGAAGATEVGFCWLMLSQDEDTILLAPHIWDEQEDEELPKLKLVSPKDKIAKKNTTAFLSNSFAFGGNNCSVIVGITK